VHPAERVALGQLKRLPSIGRGRCGGMRPFERLVQRVGVRSVGVEPAAHPGVVRLEAPARRAQRARHAVAQRV